MNPNTAGFVPYVSRFPEWVDQWLTRLDYFWFIALLAWSLALVVWWWHPRRAAFGRSAWGWLPWSAGAGVLTAATEFALLNSDIGPTPQVSLDVGLGLLPLLAAAGWWWQSTAGRAPGRRMLGGLALLPFVAAGIFRHQSPVTGGWIAAGAAFVSIVPWWRKPGAGIWSRLALILAALLPAGSIVGPVTVMARLYPRILLQNAGILGAGAFLALVACVALAGVARDAVRALNPETRRRLWPELRPFLLAGALWAAICLTLGTVFSRQQAEAGLRFGLEQVRRVASQIDFRLLAAALGPQFQLDPASLPARDSRDRVLVATAPHLASGIADPIVRLLSGSAGTGRAGLKAVSILTMRDDWLVVALSSNRFEQPGRVRLAHPVTERERDLWEDRAEYSEGPMSTNAGSFDFLRLPLVLADGTMLGWLEFANARGGYAPFRARTAPFVSTVLGFVVAALFFVQRHHLREREAALREAAVVAESARVKTDFLAKVSHELRTPLQSILGYGELLQDDIPGEAGRARLAALQQNSLFMLRLVNDLLDLSAMEAGGFRFVEKPTPLAELVRQAVDSLRPRATAKGLALTCAVAPDFPPWVATDGERCRQIVLNLVANAVKFTERGRVEVTLAVVAREDGVCLVELAVRDTGPGIPPAEQPRLFQAFSRLDLTATKEGTGLGLALTAGLCRTAGGALTLESDGLTGACFRAQLRLRPVPAPATPVTTPFPTLHGRRVLVVDDNALVRDLFAAWFTELGATCESAGDGEAALACAHAATFDAVVLDLALPKLDGCTVARRLRALGHAWRIVGVSAHASGGDRAHALAAGMDVFLSKPVELPALATALVGGAAPAPDSERHLRLRAQFSARFRSTAAAEAAHLREAFDRSDWPALRARAHQLKSSAGVVGDERLYLACAALEDAADPAAIRLAWPSIEAALVPWLQPPA